MTRMTIRLLAVLAVIVFNCSKCDAGLINLDACVSLGHRREDCEKNAGKGLLGLGKKTDTSATNRKFNEKDLSLFPEKPSYEPIPDTETTSTYNDGDKSIDVTESTIGKINEDHKNPDRIKFQENDESLNTKITSTTESIYSTEILEVTDLVETTEIELKLSHEYEEDKGITSSRETLQTEQSYVDETTESLDDNGQIPEIKPNVEEANIQEIIETVSAFVSEVTDEEISMMNEDPSYVSEIKEVEEVVEIEETPEIDPGHDADVVENVETIGVAESSESISDYAIQVEKSEEISELEETPEIISDYVDEVEKTVKLAGVEETSEITSSYAVEEEKIEVLEIEETSEITSIHEVQMEKNEVPEIKVTTEIPVLSGYAGEEEKTKEISDIIEDTPEITSAYAIEVEKTNVPKDEETTEIISGYSIEEKTEEVSKVEEKPEIILGYVDEVEKTANVPEVEVTSEITSSYAVDEEKTEVLKIEEIPEIPSSYEVEVEKTKEIPDIIEETPEITSGYAVEVENTEEVSKVGKTPEMTSVFADEVEKTDVSEIEEISEVISDYAHEVEKTAEVPEVEETPEVTSGYAVEKEKTEVLKIEESPEIPSSYEVEVEKTEVPEIKETTEITSGYAVEEEKTKEIIEFVEETAEIFSNYDVEETREIYDVIEETPEVPSAYAIEGEKSKVPKEEETTEITSGYSVEEEKVENIPNVQVEESEEIAEEIEEIEKMYEVPEVLRTLETQRDYVTEVQEILTTPTYSVEVEKVENIPNMEVKKSEEISEIEKTTNEKDRNIEEIENFYEVPEVQGTLITEPGYVDEIKETLQEKPAYVTEVQEILKTESKEVINTEEEEAADEIVDLEGNVDAALLVETDQDHESGVHENIVLVSEVTLETDPTSENAASHNVEVDTVYEIKESVTKPSSEQGHDEVIDIIDVNDIEEKPETNTGYVDEIDKIIELEDKTSGNTEIPPPSDLGYIAEAETIVEISRSYEFSDSNSTKSDDTKTWDPVFKVVESNDQNSELDTPATGSRYGSYSSYLSANHIDQITNNYIIMPYTLMDCDDEIVSSLKSNSDAPLPLPSPIEWMGRKLCAIPVTPAFHIFPSKENEDSSVNFQEDLPAVHILDNSTDKDNSLIHPMESSNLKPQPNFDFYSKTGKYYLSHPEEDSKKQYFNDQTVLIHMPSLRHPAEQIVPAVVGYEKKSSEIIDTLQHSKEFDYIGVAEDYSEHYLQEQEQRISKYGHLEVSNETATLVYPPPTRPPPPHELLPDLPSIGTHIEHTTEEPVYETIKKSIHLQIDKYLQSINSESSSKHHESPSKDHETPLIIEASAAKASRHDLGLLPHASSHYQNGKHELVEKPDTFKTRIPLHRPLHPTDEQPSRQPSLSSSKQHVYPIGRSNPHSDSRQGKPSSESHPVWRTPNTHHRYHGPLSVVDQVRPIADSIQAEIRNIRKDMIQIPRVIAPDLDVRQSSPPVQPIVNLKPPRLMYDDSRRYPHRHLQFSSG